MSNMVQILGHLGADIEEEPRVTPNGHKVRSIRVATRYKRNNKDETIWWKVTLWGDRFDKFLPYLKKGSAIIVVGEMSKPEVWTDREGRPQVSLEITAEFLRFSPFGKPDRPQQEGTGAVAPAYGAYAPAAASSFASQMPSFGAPPATASALGHGAMAEEEEIPF